MGSTENFFSIKTNNATPPCPTINKMMIIGEDHGYLLPPQFIDNKIAIEDPTTNIIPA